MLDIHQNVFVKVNRHQYLPLLSSNTNTSVMDNLIGQMTNIDR